MSNNAAIDVYLRIRPTDKPSKTINVVEDQNKIEFNLRKQTYDEAVGVQKRVYKFNELFDMTAKQDKVFDRVALDVVDGAMQGFNGTVFAYGQTGSGKTFTMVGGQDDFEDRGIIPRTFDHLFMEMSKRTTEQISIFASFIQIYNGIGYDLCPEGRDKKFKNIEDLQRVIHRQDADGQTHLINLAVHQIRDRNEAFGLLQEGTKNRIICKTQMNDGSTRSHCIFKIIVQIRKNGSDIKTTSVIHLVDLSGSERIKNTDQDGKTQYQARKINLALFYLERVITSLNDKMKGNNLVVPYRQSLLTMILKNSLGGNCRTRMIATISARDKNLSETISTCEFAKRIACIKNAVFKNQSVDPQIIISKIRNQNAQLKAQLGLLKGADQKDFLDQYDIQDCHKKVDKYVQSNDEKAALVFSDRLRIQECFSYFKTLVKAGGKFGVSSIDQKAKADSKKQDNFAQRQKYQQQIKRLKLLNKKQQQQIISLMTEIKKYTNISNTSQLDITLPTILQTEEEKYYKQQNLIQKSMVQQSKAYSDKSTILKDSMKVSEIKPDKRQEDRKRKEQERKRMEYQKEKEDIYEMLITPIKFSLEEIKNPNNQAMIKQEFKKNYKKQSIIIKNEVLLKQKLTEGKQHHKIINKIKQQINMNKNKLQRLRQQMLIQNMKNGSNTNEIPEHPQQNNVINQMHDLKQKMKSHLDILRALKSDTEGIEQILQRNHQMFNRDFEKYIGFMIRMPA